MIVYCLKQKYYKLHVVGRGLKYKFDQIQIKQSKVPVALNALISP